MDELENEIIRQNILYDYIIERHHLKYIIMKYKLFTKDNGIMDCSRDLLKKEIEEKYNIKLKKIYIKK